MDYAINKNFTVKSYIYIYIYIKKIVVRNKYPN